MFLCIVASAGLISNILDSETTYISIILIFSFISSILIYLDYLNMAMKGLISSKKEEKMQEDVRYR
jgi:hypothetical protein